MIAVTLAAELLIQTFVGVFARKKNIIDDHFISKLTNLMFTIIIPIMIFHSIRGSMEFSFEKLQICGAAAILGLVVILLSILIGHIAYLVQGKTGYARIMRYCLSFCHYSFMGIPVINGLYGEVGNLYYAFFMVAVRIAYFSLSEALLVPPGEKGTQMSGTERLKKILLNPCLLAVIAGMIFWIGNIPVPEMINYCIKQFSAVCSPLGLLLCGMTLGKYSFKKLFSLHYLIIPVARCIVMPAIFLGISRIFLMMGVDPMVCNIAVIYSALPIPSLTTVYVLKHDPDKDNQFEAVGASVLSVVLSAITIPIWYMILS